MKALVTGAHGFLGTAISKVLAEHEWEVVRCGRPDHEIPSPAFDTLVAASAPALVIHCAAPASVADSLADPARDRVGTVDVLERVLDRVGRLDRSPRFILLSSAAVYGQPERLPVSEDDPLAPISPYGTHRVEAEALLQGRGLDATALRIFSAYGPGLKRQVFWDISRRALEGLPVHLAGTGAETRDFVHVDDVAHAVACVARASDPLLPALNVATGRETTIADLARLVLHELARDDAATFTGASRPGDPLHWRADMTRLEALGFTPRISIEEGVRGYARWARTQLNHVR